MRKDRGFQRLRVVTPGFEAVVADSAHAFGRHMHEDFGIGLIERGAQKSASGRGTVEAIAGDLITVNPGEVHDGRPMDAAGRRWRMLYVEPHTLLAAATDVVPGAAFEFTQPVLRVAPLVSRFRALFDAVQADDTGLQAEAALLQLAAGLLRPTTTRPVSPTSAALRAARERMHDDPAASPTLAGLAAEAGLSRYQFLRAFTRLTGLPPHAYLLQRRVQRARQLVRGGVTLAEAATASGFADQSHMTRCFVRTLGLTPGAFVPR